MGVARQLCCFTDKVSSRPIMFSLAALVIRKLQYDFSAALVGMVHALIPIMCGHRRAMFRVGR